MMSAVKLPEVYAVIATRILTNGPGNVKHWPFALVNDPASATVDPGPVDIPFDGEMGTHVPSVICT